jgi:hypothetical protein
VEAPIKRTKYPAYFISELAHVVAFTDERLPFTSLTTGKCRKIGWVVYLLNNSITYGVFR